MTAVHVIGAGLAGLSAAARLAQAANAWCCTRRARRPAAAAGPMSTPCSTCRSTTATTSSYRVIAAPFPTSRWSAPAIACAGRDEPTSISSISPAGSVGRCGSATAFSRGGFQRQPRVPNARVRDYLVLAPLMVLPGRKNHRAKMIDCTGALYDRLVEPFFLATLNNAPPEISARLADRPCCTRPSPPAAAPTAR